MKFDIYSFSGMNNVSPFVSRGVAYPETIMDAIPSINGKLIKRPGYEKKIALTNGSDLWSSPRTGFSYCIDNGFLCTVNFQTFTVSQILQVPDIQTEKVYYFNHGDIDYAGNRYWLTAIENGVPRKFGQLADDLQNLNWHETENGRVLYLIDSAGNETFIPHPGEFVHAPEPMNFLSCAHGRCWGCRGNKLFYSHPLMMEWWEDDKNYFEFLNDITMLAFTPSGIFVGTEKETVFFFGRDPAQVETKIVSYTGVVKNSLVFVPSINEMPNEIPLWMNTESHIVAGLPDGNIVELTKEKINIEKPTFHGNGCIVIDGMQHILFRIAGEYSLA